MTFPWSRALRGACLALLLPAAGLLASCGGGDRIGSFTPNRVVAFGDERSVITGTGKKYTVNAAGTDKDSSLCAVNPNWVVYLANAFNRPFPDCPLNGSTSASDNRAVVGAKVADVADQVSRYVSDVGGFGERDLVAVFVGINDVLEQYSQYPTVGEADLSAELDRRGQALAAQVNTIAEAGGKVLIVSLPDQGLTPYALDQREQFITEGDRAALLTRLTSSFNAGLKSTLTNDGSKIGLVAGDEQSRLMVSRPGNYGLVDVITAACDTTKRDGSDTGVLPNCSEATLLDNATSTTYLWADSLNFGPVGHRQIGAAAVNRTNNNPF